MSIPLPKPLTIIQGVHQSDVIIKSAIQVAIADIRANPELLNYVFASLPQDAVTWKAYGEKDIAEAKKWFLSTDIPVAIMPRIDEGKVPLITIELLSSNEVTSESTLGDVHSEPEEENDMNWPALSLPFTPVSYTPSTGLIEVAEEFDVGLFPGMFIVDRNGVAHEIVDVVSDTEFYIDENVIADLRGAILKGHRPAWSVSVESSSFAETYRIGLYCQNEPIYLSWLHSIVVFALLRYKQSMLEGRGFERTTFSSTQAARDGTFEAENVYSRFINISGNVRHYWPKNFSQVIDGVQMDPENGIRVSGDGVDVGAGGMTPSSQLWTGNAADDEE